MNTTSASNLSPSGPQGACVQPLRFTKLFVWSAQSLFWHPPRPNHFIKRTCLRQAAYVER
jgi:hypothetical protein